MIFFAYGPVTSSVVTIHSSSATVTYLFIVIIMQTTASVPWEASGEESAPSGIGFLLWRSPFLSNSALCEARPC